MVRASGAVAALSVAVAAVATGCGGSSAPAAAPATSSVSPTVSPCPTPSDGKDEQWPAQVPRDLPKPPHLTIVSQQTTSDGVHLVRFSTPMSLRESVLFVVNRLPRAGYVLGRGDAEASEADAPFVHGEVRGLLKMVATLPCRTDWLLATVHTGSTASNSPLLSPSPSSSPSPLPFH